MVARLAEFAPEQGSKFGSTAFRSGNPGDVRPVGEGVSELRVDTGSGYRVYYASRGSVVVLLCGGDKKTQDNDIARAKALAKEWDDGA